MTKIYIMLACNNPDNGMPTGYVDGIEVGAVGQFDNFLSLRGGRLSMRKLSQTILKIGHIWLPIRNYSNWVGNWCWDEVGVEAKDAARMLAYLQRRGWQCEQGIIELFDKWRRCEPITREDLQKAVQP